jgi:1-acyl-sn-glycerol-3-phosphate acyltransferase
MVLYRILRVVVRLFFPLLLDIRITGDGNIPRSGPVLLVSNHDSYTDPVVLGAACPRPVHYLGKQELFEHGRVFAWLIRTLGCVPIRRDRRASSAIRRAEELLNAGEVVGVFPEGGIGTTGDLKGGVALLALRTGAPVVPVYLGGTRRMYEPGPCLLRTCRVRVEVGKPLRVRDADGPSNRAERTERLMETLQSYLIRDDGAIQGRIIGASPSPRR